MDNGKPIRESRDIDIPLVIRHFYHHAGWAELIDSEFPGLRAGRRLRADHPVEFSAADARLEDRAGARGGKHGGAEAGGVHAADRARLRRALQGGGAARRRRQHRDGRRRDRARSSSSIRTSTRSPSPARPRSAASSARRPPAPARSCRWSSAENRPSSSSTMPISTARSRASSTPSGSTRARSAAPARASSCRKRSRRRCTHKLRARMATLRVGDPLDKSTDIGAIVADVQLDRIRALVEQGRAEGAVCYQPEGAMPDKGLFYPPTLVTGLAPASILAQEEIFGPVLVSMTFRTPDEALALANNSRYGLAASIWSESINVTLDAAARVKAGVVWINSTNLFDAAAGFGGYREVRLRPRRRARGALRISRAGEGEERTAKAQGRVPRASSRPRPKCATIDGDAPDIDRTAKTLYRRQAGAARFRLQLHRPRRARRLSSGRPGSAIARTSGTRSRRRPRAGGWSTRHGAQSRAGALLHRRESRRPRRRVQRAPAEDGERLEESAAAEVAQADPPLLLLCGAGRQIRRPGARDALAPCHARHERAVGRDGDAVPERGAAARLRLAGHAGDRHGQPRRRRAVAGRSACRPPISIRCSTRATCRAASSTSSPATARFWRRRSPSTTTSPPSGISARRRGARASRPPRSAISRRPGSIMAAPIHWSDPAEGQGRIYLRHATQVKNIWVPYGE